MTSEQRARLEYLADTAMPGEARTVVDDDLLVALYTHISALEAERDAGHGEWASYYKRRLLAVEAGHDFMGRSSGWHA